MEQKFEQRSLSYDEFDAFIAFLSGDQQSTMEISYTKQQQKQKQKQSNKNQDADAFGLFHRENQLTLRFETENYFKDTLDPQTDVLKLAFNLPCPIPITTVQYQYKGATRTIHVYPTLQFLYSHHIDGTYITQDVQEFYQLPSWDRNNATSAYKGFWKHAVLSPTDPMEEDKESDKMSSTNDDVMETLGICVLENKVRQNGQYTLVGLKEGAFVIGMKEQFNVKRKK